MDGPPERLGSPAPDLVVLLHGNDPEHRGGKGTPIDEGVGDAARAQPLRQLGIGPEKDDARAEGLRDLRTGEAGPLPSPHQQDRVARADPEPLHDGAVGGAVRQQHPRELLGRVPRQRPGHRDRPFLLDHRELRVEPVVGLVPANAPASPRVEDDRLPDPKRLHGRAGIHDDPERVAPGDVKGGGVPSPEHRDRKAQRGEVRVEVRTRGQDRHEHPGRVLRVQPRDGDLLEADRVGRWAVPVAVDRERLHALRNPKIDSGLLPERPGPWKVCVHGVLLRDRSARRALSRFLEAPRGLSLRKSRAPGSFAKLSLPLGERSRLVRHADRR
jgi:hypothetical protein